jgi:predicted Zn-dependent protease
MTPKPRRAWLALLVLLPALAGCQVNPATGRQSFTGLMSERQEAETGRQSDAEVRQQFGGGYQDAALQRYIDGLGRLLASTSERPEVRFTFTILDTPVVNAFALPGGYVYVTRGLLALAGSEAEAAGVLAHEIGHVAARHAAERYSEAMVAQLGALGLGLLTGSPELAQLAGTGAMVWLQSHSREQEFEADRLGVRYLSRANFDPEAMASFLSRLEANAALEATIAGHPGTQDKLDIMATHPRTPDRVRQAIAEAGGYQVADPIVGRDLYLRKVDGLLYGDDPKDGVVRGRRFIHPGLRLQFEVPPGFRLVNGRDKVVAAGPGGSALQFDRAPQAGGDPRRYLVEQWAARVRLDGVESTTVNGLPAATGVVRSGSGATLRLVAIGFDPQAIYRFVFLIPRDAPAATAAALQRTAVSFRRLSAAEAAAVRPQRLQILTVAAGDTVESLAASLPFEDYRTERFRVLNGLQPGDRLKPGQLVKTIRE